MQRQRVALAIAFFVAAAGCTGNAATASKDALVPGAGFDGLGLEATKTTGVIRGLVVDEAIAPLAGAAVTATGAGVTGLELVTGDDGLFGFDGLDPGVYFLQASKPGYQNVQVDVEVVAGEDKPAPERLILLADPTTAPFA